MGIFSNKIKNKEDEDVGKKDLDEKKDEISSLKVKKIKDLSPENKKRRREPIRAWNKFDRMFILLVIAVTSGYSVFLSLSSRGYKFPKIPDINLKDLNPFTEQVVVLDSNKETSPDKKMIIDSFVNETKNLEGKYGLYVYDFQSKHSYGIFTDETFTAASLIKLPVMLGMYNEEEGGRLSLSTRYKLQAEDKVKGSGSLYNKPVGYEITYRELIRLMGKESDNTAFNICQKLLGEEKIQNLVEQIGMKNTSLKHNTTTPRDIGTYFRALEDTEIIKNKNKEELLSFLTETTYEKWLTLGVPDEIKVSHKYGRETKTVNDAGIVNSKNPYVVVILSDGVSLNEADDIFPRLSKLIYEDTNK